MSDFVLYFSTKLVFLIQFLIRSSSNFFFEIHYCLYLVDDILHSLALKYEILWPLYEKFFFKQQNRSFNFYSRIMWKPSLNISDHIFNVPIFFVLQTIFLVIISVWARAVGPRMRMDQLSQFVWKDFVPSLTLILILILIIMSF